MVISTSKPSSSSSKSPHEQQRDWQHFVSQHSEKSASEFSELFSAPIELDQIYGKNCENVVGAITIPVGVAGPVKVLSSSSSELLIPLATTEGALVASVARGCKAINQAGGATVHTEKIGMSRAPVFICRDGAAALDFKKSLDSDFATWKAATESTSSHLKLRSIDSWVRGRQVFARFVFDTDEAMGMNMVSLALQSAWDNLAHEYSAVDMGSLSSNVCTDKKDSVVNRLYGRGYWAQAEVFMSAEVIAAILKTTPEKLLQTHYEKNLIGSNLAGSFSQNMQVANVVAAFFAATGQDIAHVVEGSQASTTIESADEGIYAAVTLPNVNVGTVGGGLSLAPQTQARQLISPQPVTAAVLVQALSVAALAAELSGLAALSSQSLALAHQRLGRSGKKI